MKNDVKRKMTIAARMTDEPKSLLASDKEELFRCTLPRSLLDGKSRVIFPHRSCRQRGAIAMWLAANSISSPAPHIYNCVVKII
jgi:hypothetical protein